jgi:ABC-2 type transport system ATP-binding protein
MVVPKRLSAKRRRVCRSPRSAKRRRVCRSRRRKRHGAQPSLPGRLGHYGPEPATYDGQPAGAVHPPERPSGSGMIEASDLTKLYGDKVAVDHLTFTVEPGRVTGFLGPNGAGKSTTMRLILGLDRPQSGSATINGRPYAGLPQPLLTVGALLEAKAMHPGRSAYDHLLYMAQSQGLPRRRVDEVLDLVGLSEVARKRTRGYSLGMSQRAGIAVAMLGNPQVLLLDEPVNGLDPEGVLWIRNLMKQLASEERTIFVSSHLMNEMAVTADHLIVIGKGKLIADCPTAEFIARSSEKSVLVRSPQAPRLASLIQAEGGTATVTEPDHGEAREISVTGMEAPRVGEIAAGAGIVLHELTPRLGSLEEAFMELTAGSVEYGAPSQRGTPREGSSA